MAKLIMGKLSINHHDLMKFMATYTLASSLGISTSALFDKCSPIKNDDDLMMDEEEYKEFWLNIATCGFAVESNVPTSRLPTPFYQDFETTLNSFLRELFIERRVGKISLALDDDKVHYECTKPYPHSTLKVTKHVRDNARGFYGL